MVISQSISQIYLTYTNPPFQQKTIYIESGWALLNDGPRYLSGNDANCLGN